MGTQLPMPQKGGDPQIFGLCLLRPNGWMDQDATWYAGRPHCARWGPNSPQRKGGTAPQFSAYVCCGQMVGCIKMPLGTMAGLGPGNTKMRTQFHPPRVTAPNFQSMSVLAKWLHGSRCHLVRGRPRPRPVCYMGTQLPSKKGQCPLIFG